jgi:hypothetical protein
MARINQAYWDILNVNALAYSNVLTRGMGSVLFSSGVVLPENFRIIDSDNYQISRDIGNVTYAISALPATDPTVALTAQAFAQVPAKSSHKKLKLLRARQTDGDVSPTIRGLAVNVHEMDAIGEYNLLNNVIVKGVEQLCDAFVFEFLTSLYLGQESVPGSDGSLKAGSADGVTTTTLTQTYWFSTPVGTVESLFTKDLMPLIDEANYAYRVASNNENWVLVVPPFVYNGIAANQDTQVRRMNGDMSLGTTFAVREYMTYAGVTIVKLPQEVLDGADAPAADHATGYLIRNDAMVVTMRRREPNVSRGIGLSSSHDRIYTDTLESIKAWAMDSTSPMSFDPYSGVAARFLGSMKQIGAGSAIETQLEMLWNQAMTSNIISIGLDENLDYLDSIQLDVMMQMTGLRSRPGLIKRLSIPLETTP